MKPPATERRAPRPKGLLSGRRGPWRRFLSLTSAWLNRGFDRLPVGRLVHRIVQRGLCFSAVEIPLRHDDPRLDGLRIAFLSDIHAGSYMHEGDLCKIFEKVSAQDPHLICIGGDLINTREREVLLYRRPLELVDPPLGVFAIPGNHDHFWGRDLGLWSPFLRDQGVRVLNNEGVRLEWNGASLWLAGVDDLTEGDPSLVHALDGMREGEPVVLLSHHPDFFFEAAAVEVDLTLAGHTHGGQLAPWGKALIVHSQFGYLQGKFEENGSFLYVSRGVGVTVLPLRVGAPAEVPVIVLRSSGRKAGQGR